MFNLSLYHLLRCQGISDILWTTYRNTNTIGQPRLTIGQQTAGASSGDNTGKSMDKRHITKTTSP